MGAFVRGGLARLDDVIGIGQSWQSVIGSRAGGVVYTNTTGKPIQLGISVMLPASSNCNLVIDGQYVAEFGTGSNNQYFALGGIVPAGKTYKVDFAGGGNLTRWTELRA